MNKRRLIWGIICLALTVLLAIFYFGVPGVEIVFKMVNINLSFIPVFIPAVIGIWLLVTVRK